MPVVLREGLTDEDIVRFTSDVDEDNTNDEYHTRVSPVDVWASYAYLKESEGWTQERIAEAKNVGQSWVSIRLKLHKLPGKIKTFITQGLLDEAHLREISSLLLESYSSPWLTTSQAWEELAALAVKNKLTVRETQKEVTKWKEFIGLANDLYGKLDPAWQQDFVTRLAKSEARNKAAVQTAYGETVKAQPAEARREEEELANHTLVSIRLKLHKLPDKIKNFCTQELLEETHLREIMNFELEYKFSPWLTTFQAWEELAAYAAASPGRLARAAGKDAGLAGGGVLFTVLAVDVGRRRLRC